MTDVVLVHGLYYGPVSMQLLARRLRRQGYRCRTFGYPTVRGSLPENARRLRKFLDGIQTDTLHLVGHSLGGLVILRMLDEFGDLPPGRVVLLGSSVKGSGVAAMAGEMTLTRPFIGEAAKWLKQGFDRAPADRETGVIAGTRGFGLGRIVPGLEDPGDGTVALAETELPGAAARIELPVSHTGLVLSAAVARAVGRFLATGSF